MMESKTENLDLSCLFCYRAVKLLPDTSINLKFKYQQRFFTLITRQMLNHICGSAINDREKRWCRNNLESFYAFLGHKIKNDDGPMKIFQFCRKCEKITRQFCELYDKIELLKLKLDWKINTLSKAMRCADKKYSVNIYSDNSLENSFNGRFEKKIRKTLNLSFKTYQKFRNVRSFPRVQLSSIVIKNDAEEDDVPSLFDPIHLEQSPIQPEAVVCGGTITTELEEENNGINVAVDYKTVKKKPDDFILIDLCNSPPPSQENEIPVNERSPLLLRALLPVPEKNNSLAPILPSESSSVLKCTFCSFCTHLKYNLMRHNITHHPDQYFIAAKLSRLSNDQFNNCIVYLLRQIVNDSFKGNSTFECSFCASKFNGRQGIRDHLTMKHPSSLEEKLVEIQKSGSLILNSMPKKSVTTKNFSDKVCSFCSKIFQKNEYLKRHQLIIHPEIYFEEHKSTTMETKVFRSFIVHLVDQGFTTISADTGTQTVTDNKGRPKTKHRCHYCDKDFSNSSDVKIHLILKHRQNIVKRLKNMMSSGKTAAGILLEIFRNRRIKMNTRITKARKTKLSRRIHVCTVCGKKFKEGFHLNHHQSYEHPELFFESSNFLWRSQENSVYKKFVNNFLEQETYTRFTKINKTTVQGNHMKLKCAICLKVIFNTRLAKIHLVLRHRKLMAGKLEHLQNGEKTKNDIEDELEKAQRSTRSSIENSSREHTFSNSSEQNVCKFCLKRFCLGRRLKEHVAFQHPAMFFERFKSSTLTFVQFDQCVKNMLSVEFETLVKFVDDVYGTVKWQCPFCPRRIIGANKNVKSHVFISHLEELGEKLKQVQDTSRM